MASMKTFGGCILAAALIGGMSPVASALPVGDAGDLLAPAPLPRNEIRQPRISAAQAAARARREHGGRVLGVSLERGARPYYRVKLLKDGNVRSVRVPAD